MAKQQQHTWQAKVNDVERTFTLDFIPSGKESGFILSVDGTVALKTPKKWLASMVGYDLPFNLDGRDMRLIIPLAYKNADIAVDGRYLSNGKKYVPLPKWIWAFLFPIGLLVVTGGFIGAFTGILGFFVCQKAAKSSLNTLLRVLICIGIMVMAWILYAAIVVVFGLIF